MRTTKDYRFDIINRERDKRGWSYNDMAAETGRSADTCMRACKGKNITIGSLNKICDALGLEDARRAGSRKEKKSRPRPRSKGR